MKLGFVGLGDMGSLIVPRLLAAGHEVAGWNRTPHHGAPLLAVGVRWAPSPCAAARDGEIVFSIVPDGAAVTEIALGTNGVITELRPGGTFIDMSTISPTVSRKVAAAFAAAGSTMLDAPISGSPITLK